MASGTHRLKDTNAADTMFRLTLGLRLGPLVMLILLGVEYLHWGSGFIWFVIPDVAITVLVVIAAQWALDTFGSAAGSILLPTSRSTPAPREYSEQESLIVRGQFIEAVDSFKAIVADDPGNIDARMRLGALLERECNDPAAAEQCYRVVRRLTPTPEQDWAASNALIELHQRTGDVAKLRIELQRIARQYPALSIGAEALRRLGLLPGGIAASLK